MKVLVIGDIVGRPGRSILREMLAKIKKDNNIDICIANGENAATGNGITSKIVNELYSYGVDIITLGNHTWAKTQIFDFIDNEECMIRPANYVEDLPGKGSMVYYSGSTKIGVVNINGRIYYGDDKHEISCPFKSVDKEIEELRKTTNIIFVDFHAEATSEKIAMGWYLDGKVSVVFGTHTHVQTADERILPNKTGYITDIGMTGPYNSVIGIEKDIIIEKFLNDSKVKFKIAEGEMQLNGIICSIDDKTGECTSIERVKYLMN